MDLGHRLPVGALVRLFLYEDVEFPTEHEGIILSQRGKRNDVIELLTTDGEFITLLWYPDDGDFIEVLSNRPC